MKVSECDICLWSLNSSIRRLWDLRFDCTHWSRSSYRLLEGKQHLKCLSILVHSLNEEPNCKWLLWVQNLLMNCHRKNFQEHETLFHSMLETLARDSNIGNRETWFVSDLIWRFIEAVNSLLDYMHHTGVEFDEASYNAVIMAFTSQKKFDQVSN